MVDKLEEAFRAGWEKCWQRDPDAPCAVDGGKRAAWERYAATLSTPANGEQVEREWSLPDLRDLHTDVERIRDHDLGNKRMRNLLRAAMDALIAADAEYAALGNKETDRHG